MLSIFEKKLLLELFYNLFGPLTNNIIISKLFLLFYMICLYLSKHHGPQKVQTNKLKVKALFLRCLEIELEHDSIISSEFLKGATVRPYGRANFFRVIFKKILLVFGPFGLRKTFEQKYWSRKKIAFRKSESAYRPSQI